MVLVLSTSAFVYGEKPLLLLLTQFNIQCISLKTPINNERSLDIKQSIFLNVYSLLTQKEIKSYEFGKLSPTFKN